MEGTKGLPVTVTVKKQFMVMPLLSVKVYVTTVTPLAKNDPGSWVLNTSVTMFPSESTAMGSAQLTVAPVNPRPTGCTMSSGQLRANRGGSRSEGSN